MLNQDFSNGKTMKKIKFAPIWKLEDLEKWLESMDESGYRLDQIKFGLIYCFKKSTPKKARYFFSIISVRGISMDNWCNMLLSEFSANEINVSFSRLALFRILKEKDMKLLIESRLSFIKRMILEYLFTTGLLTILSIFCLFWNHSLGMIFLAIIFPLFIYYLFGFFAHIKKIKKS